MLSTLYYLSISYLYWIEENVAFYDLSRIAGYVNKRNKTNTVLMEVTPDIYKYIRENKSRVFIGHQCSRVYDLININPCLNCGGFNHNGYKCKNEPVCTKCNLKHSVRDCRSNKIECVNCSYNNTKYRTSLPTDHQLTEWNAVY